MVEHENEIDLAKVADNNELSDLLTQWKLSDYIENFKQNKVTIQMFPKLSDFELKELIPPIGDRIQFKRNCNSMIDNKKKRRHSNNNDEEAITSKKVANNESSSSKIIFDPDLLIHLIPPVEETLNKSKVGQAIMYDYMMKSVLLESQRSRMVDILIMDLSSRTERINDNVLENLAKKICTFFSTETLSTYFQPAIKKSKSSKGKSMASKGKLPIKWRNMKQLTKIEKTLEMEEGRLSNVEFNEVEDPKVDESIKWLQENDCAMFDLAKKHWQITAERRLKKIYVDDKSLNEIFQRFKILRQPEAYRFIDLDFCYLELTEKELTEESWTIFFKSIVQLTKEHKKNNNAKSLKKFINDSEINIDSCIKAQIELLCHLLPPTAVLKRKKADGSKEIWKVSVAESFDSIIQYTALTTDIDEVRNDRINFMQDHGKTVQPYVIVTGSSVKKLDGFYVIINNDTYKLPTMLEALKTCFQRFHVFGISYPFESEHLWLVIQKGLFGFKTKWDKLFSHTEGIIHSLSKQINSKTDFDVDESEIEDEEGTSNM